MKRILLTTVSVLALASAQPGLAADLGARMPVKAPPPVRVFSWTGCYIGGHVGWGWGRTRLTDPVPGNLVGSLTDFNGTTSVTADTDGFLGGGQIGCDYQLATNWVIGLEGQFSGADISGTYDGVTGTSFHAKTDWLANVTGRLGYAWDPRWLIYVKGGAAWAHDKYDVTYLGTWSATTTRDGWTVGGGLEWAFADNWSAKLEYQYYDFGDKDLTFLYSGSLPFTSSAETVRSQIHTVKIGLNYHFGLH